MFFHLLKTTFSIYTTSTFFLLIHIMSSCFFSYFILFFSFSIFSFTFSPFNLIFFFIFSLFPSLKLLSPTRARNSPIRTSPTPPWLKTSLHCQNPNMWNRGSMNKDTEHSSNLDSIWSESHIHGRAKQNRNLRWINTTPMSDFSNHA